MYEFKQKEIEEVATCSCDSHVEKVKKKENWIEKLKIDKFIIELFNIGIKKILLAFTIGLPLYVSGSGALPLMKSLMNSGASEGAILAFLITGKATGIPVIVGLATILKKRALFFYVGFVYFAGIISGYLYQLYLNL